MRRIARSDQQQLSSSRNRTSAAFLRTIDYYLTREEPRARSGTYAEKERIDANRRGAHDGCMAIHCIDWMECRHAGLSM